MTTRRYSLYTKPGLTPHKIGRWARGDVDSILVNGAVANYAETRRNQMALIHNIGAPQLTWSGEEDLGWNDWFHCPIGQRIVRQGGSNILRVYVLAETSSEVSGHTARLRFRIGETEVGEVSILSVTKSWHTCDIPLADIPVADDTLYVSYNADSGNTLTVYSISLYQPGVFTTNYHDLNFANCVLGDPDYPDSALARKLIRDNVVAIRDHKTMRANVFNHFFFSYYKKGTTYGSDSDDMGNYRVVKRAGIEQVIVYVLAGKYNLGEPDWTCKVTFNGVAQTITITADTPIWFSTTFTLTGSDITDEIEVELKIDGLEATNVAEMVIPGVVAVEVPAAAITHSVPDPLDVQLPSKIEAGTWDDVRTTMMHLYERGGCGILVADWRCSTFDGATGADTCHPNVAPGSLYKYDYGETNMSTIVRAMVFPSTGVTYIRIRMGYHTYGNSDYVKWIIMQISDSMVFDTWDDVHPLYADNTHGAYQFTAAVEEADDEEIIECELAVNSADWESHGTGTPLQVWVSAATDNAAEYVLPAWVTIEEVVLKEDQFP